MLPGIVSCIGNIPLIVLIEGVKLPLLRFTPYWEVTLVQSTFTQTKALWENSQMFPSILLKDNFPTQMCIYYILCVYIIPRFNQC